MTLYEIIFLIMFAIFIIVMGVVAVAEMLTYAKSKEISKTIEVYQKNFEEINKVLENHNKLIQSLTEEVESLKAKRTEIICRNRGGNRFKQWDWNWSEQDKKDYDLMQKKISNEAWEYLGGKKK